MNFYIHVTKMLSIFVLKLTNPRTLMHNTLMGTIAFQYFISLSDKSMTLKLQIVFIIILY